MGVLVYLGLCLLPAAVFKLAIDAVERWSNPAADDRRAAAGAVEPAPAPQDGYSKALRRLSAEHDRLMSADVPGRATRLRAVETAYDDTLRNACKAFDIAEPPAPWDGLTRVQAEAELALHGLSW